MTKSTYPENPQPAVGAIVAKDNRFLLVKRNQSPARGLWAIPGGRVKLGETLQEAAEREIKEETAVTIKARDPVYTFDLIERDDKGRVRFHYVIVDLMAEYLCGEAEPGGDASEARWVTLEELDTLQVSKTTRQVLSVIRGTRLIN